MPRNLAIPVLSILTLVLAASCAETQLAPPPRKDGPCPPRPDCAEVTCELDPRRGCEVCHCQTQVPLRPVNPPAPGAPGG